MCSISPWFCNSYCYKFANPRLRRYSTHCCDKIILLMYGNFFYFANWNMKIIQPYRVIYSFQLQWGVHFLFCIQIHYWSNFLCLCYSFFFSFLGQPIFYASLFCTCKKYYCALAYHINIPTKMHLTSQSLWFDRPLYISKLCRSCEIY